MWFDPRLLLGAILSVASWLAPQPQLSRGLIVVYGNQYLIAANARYHGYSLAPTHGCGLASISPAHLGKLAYVSVDKVNWLGPCTVVDIQGRDDALDSIYRRHEIAEVSFDMARAIGFKYGAQGYIFFGAYPPAPDAIALPYRPPLTLDTRGEVTPSLYPYTSAEFPIACRRVYH